MDIRNFFIFNKQRTDQHSRETPSCIEEAKVTTKENKEQEEVENTGKMTKNFISNKDIGKYIESYNDINNDFKLEILRDPWIPSTNYNFKGDVEEGSQQRAFRHQWLSQYNEWLVYSAEVRGALCKICVFFRPTVHRGIQGRYITKPFNRYKDFHNSCKDHIKSQWHRESTEQAKNFIDMMERKSTSIAEQINTAAHNQVEANRKKLASIVNTIIFCATHDLPLRGKISNSGVFPDLLQFRAEAGDEVIQQHLSSSSGNAKYTSHRTQNELIDICGQQVRSEIVKEAGASRAFSVIADETADISGVEQLSIGIRFVDTTQITPNVREEFLGFIPLKELNAKAIASEIVGFLQNIRLEMTKMVGQGYDGRSRLRWLFCDGRKRGRSEQIYSKSISKSLIFPLFKPQTKSGNK